ALMTVAPALPWFRFSLRTLLVLTGIVALMLGAIIGARKIFESPRGPVNDRAEWPQPLQDLLNQASFSQINVEPVQVYCIHDFTERYHYWRLTASPSLTAWMTNAWGLRAGTQTDV